MDKLKCAVFYCEKPVIYRLNVSYPEYQSWAIRGYFCQEHCAEEIRANEQFGFEAILEPERIVN